MRKIELTLILGLIFSIAQGQSLIGSWEHYMDSSNGQEFRTVVTFTDGFQVATTFDNKTGAFLATNGGLWERNEDVVTELAEFNSADPEAVGKEVSFKVFMTDSTLTIVGRGMVFKRIDDGSPGELQGAWLMSGRKRDGEIQQRDTSRPRKTMKILSGTRFQWIAYNTETKQFMGTGGGTYTTIDGKYTENIEFFSRDDSRVGASLEFDYELKEGDWHHSGFSSKGAPLYEIWSIRKE